MPLYVVEKYNPKSEIITILVRAGAKVNARDKDSRTPLHMAAAYNSKPEIITALVRAGADVDARNRYGFTSVTFGNIPEPST